MSFIYDDPKLISQLVKHALDFETKFTKEGQAANQDLITLRALLDGLANELPGTKEPGAPSEISHEKGPADPDPSDPKLTSINLEGLGALTDFLMQNKITVDGQRVAYDISQDPGSDDYQLYQLEPNAGLLEVADRSQVTKGFFVNKDLLNKYIVSLQAQLHSKPNPVMDVQLRKIVQQANTQLDSGLSEKYKAPETTLPATEVLTTFPDSLDPKFPTKDGNIQLTFGDISSAAGIKAWVNNNRISIAVPGREGGPLGINHPEYDFCVVAMTLYTKAQWLLRNKAGTPELEKKYGAFVKKMTEVAPTLQGPNGQACNLTAAHATTQTPANQGGSGAGATGTAAQLRQSASRAAAALPFAASDIDFDRIKRFFQLVAPLMSNVPAVANNIQDVEQQMNAVTGNTLNQVTIFPLGLRANQFADLFANRGTPANEYFPMLIALNRILNGTRAVVDSFVSRYGNATYLTDDEMEYVLGQVGRSPSDNSLYRRNANELERLRTTVTKQ